MNSLSSKQQLLHLLQIQSLELHQDFSALAKIPKAKKDTPLSQFADETTTKQVSEPAVAGVESFVEPDAELQFCQDVLLALQQYQPQLQWRLSVNCTAPLLQNGLLVTPSIELLQSAQQKKLLWLCLQQES